MNAIKISVLETKEILRKNRRKKITNPTEIINRNKWKYIKSNWMLKSIFVLGKYTFFGYFFFCGKNVSEMIHTHTHILNVILLEFRIDSAIIVLIEALSQFYHTNIQFSKQTLALIFDLSSIFTIWRAGNCGRMRKKIMEIEQITSVSAAII